MEKTLVYTGRDVNTILQLIVIISVTAEYVELANLIAS